jgi:hypothetical protein
VSCARSVVGRTTICGWDMVISVTSTSGGSAWISPVSPSRNAASAGWLSLPLSTAMVSLIGS